MKLIRFGFIAGFLFTASYHLYLARVPQSGDASNFDRHLVFILINLSSMGLLIWNHRRALLLLLPLIAQQLCSHGFYLWTQWRDLQRIDWPSVVVLIFMPILGYYILARKKSLV